MIIKVKYYNVDTYEITEGIVSNFGDTFKNLTIIKKVIPFDDILDVCYKTILQYE